MTEMNNDNIDTKEVKINIDEKDDNVNNTEDISEVLDSTGSSVFNDLSPDHFEQMIVENERKNRRKKNKKSKNDTNLFIDILCVVRDALICFVVAAIFATFLIAPIRVEGKSMYPTLHDNDIGFSSIIGLNLSGIKRFDIVVIYDQNEDEYIVKRVIGMPNETIQYVEDKLYIDGIPVSEPFFDEEYCTSVSLAINDYFTDDFKTVSIGEDEYFVMGDNRPNSKDSREFGVINKSQIKSKGVFVIYPFNRIGKK